MYPIFSTWYQRIRSWDFSPLLPSLARVSHHDAPPPLSPPPRPAPRRFLSLRCGALHAPQARLRPPRQAAAPSHAAAADSDAKSTWQTEKLPGELPRPPTIPFQPRVANAAHLVGTVWSPVHVQQLPDGRFSAVSVLVHDHGINLPKFW